MDGACCSGLKTNTRAELTATSSIATSSRLSAASRCGRLQTASDQDPPRGPAGARPRAALRAACAGRAARHALRGRRGQHPAGEPGRGSRACAQADALRRQPCRRRSVPSTRRQLVRFLEADGRQRPPTIYLLFLLMSRTGLRLGEALALQWGDLDLKRRELRVERTVSGTGRDIGTPKSGHGRTVDLSKTLCATLRSHKAQASAAALQGRAGGPRGCSAATGDRNRTTRPKRHSSGRSGPPACRRISAPIRSATLFASILLAAGVSPAYVQQQLGHANIGLTVGTYGRWSPEEGPRRARNPRVRRRSGSRQPRNGSSQRRSGRAHGRGRAAATDSGHGDFRPPDDGEPARISPGLEPYEPLTRAVGIPDTDSPKCLHHRKERS